MAFISLRVDMRRRSWRDGQRKGDLTFHFEAVDNVSPDTLREAQAPCWWSSMVSHLNQTGPGVWSINDEPPKALEAGQALLSYIKANLGDLHYFKEIPNDGWGE